MAGYPVLMKKLLENEGAGPNLRTDIIPDDIPRADGIILKAKQDQKGRVIDQTYITNAGDRGTLAGFETLTTSSDAVITITDSSSDDTGSSGAVAISVENGATGKVWTKTVGIDNDGATITLGDAWRWQGGKAPTVSAYSVLILKWYGTWGYASLALTS